MPSRCTAEVVGGTQVLSAACLLGTQRNFRVAIGCVEADMAQPGPDDVDFNACLQKVNRRCVPKLISSAMGKLACTRVIFSLTSYPDEL